MKKSPLIFLLILFANFYLTAQTNTFPASGKVGIGTLTPSAELDIQNGAMVLGGPYKDFIFITQHWTSTSDKLFIAPKNNGNWDWSKQLVYKDNGDFIINGNLGIGTTSPDAKLTVKGSIHANEVKVDLLGAITPDYVFYKDYDLKTLTEVENYITRKGHLPNIPSAKEMEVNGLYLKKMNLKLLEKIEELTLYTINQEKRIKHLEKENNTLKTQKDRIELLEKQVDLLLKAKE